MDWSDEYLNFGRSCPFQPNAMECDEHICSIDTNSCGDGECVPWIVRMAFQRFNEVKKDCFNKRNLNYMCEFSRDRPSWTLHNGLCWPDKDYDDPRYPSWNASNLTFIEKFFISFDVVCQRVLNVIVHVMIEIVPKS